MGTSSMYPMSCAIIRWGVSQMEQGISRSCRWHWHRKGTAGMCTGAGTGSIPGCHGVPVLFRGVRSSAVIWRVVSCRNFPFVRTV